MALEVEQDQFAVDVKVIIENKNNIGKLIKYMLQTRLSNIV